MRRIDLEHIIRAAGAITGASEIVIVGSQAILGAVPFAPAELTRSTEADVFPLHQPHLSDLIDGSIGEKSPFHTSFGYYAHGVSPETAVLPSQWRSRLVVVTNENTRGTKGLCLSLPDLAASKLVAGRQKDKEFVLSMLLHELVKVEELKDVLVELPQAAADLALQRIRNLELELKRR